ncbi:MAG: hypothetical protein KA408_06555 [Flavobacteriales bacterium]|nr:hypothetical protein [Flavobacteriales bacterium]
MRSLTFLALLFCASFMQAQENAGSEVGGVEILNADVWEFDQARAQGAQVLKGNVRFKHGKAIMKCDSAYLYEDERVRAMGRVNINQGDTLFVDGDVLEYESNARMARLEGNVHLRNGDMELTTPALDYDMNAKRALYTSGGRIISKKENNTLTSDVGLYLADTRSFIFSRNVLLDHPEHTITSDTMHYGTSSGIAEFFGPTQILQDSTIITTLRGTYDTRNERARFTKRSSILSGGRLLEGDSLHYDRPTGIGRAWGNVAVTDTASDMIVTGDEGFYDESNERSMITGHAELVILMDGDSLFLHGDSIFTVPDSAGKRVLAHRNVRFFKSDMQGVCDTLIYSDADSLIRMFNAPVLWSGSDQITGDHIRIAMKDGQAHRLFVEDNAFLVSQADSVHFDQVAGTTMTGYFVNNELDRILTEGNARTVYFAREEKDGIESIIGVNRADCSRISVKLAEGKVGTVTFMEQPDAILYPIDKAPTNELRMEGSDWRDDERPMDRQAIFDQ